MASSTATPSSSSAPPPPKARAPAVAPGIYPSDSVRMAAESIGISSLDENVAQALAGDVEFRLHQVIEEAQKFMRHSKRTTMTPSDINHALASLNIEPIYGHLPLPSSTPHFLPLKLPSNLSSSSNPKKSSSSSSNAQLSNSSTNEIYFLSDPEVDFKKLLDTPPPGLVGGGVKWKAHWLAVEGVMPRIPENVAPDHQAFRQASSASSSTKPGGTGAAANGSYLATGSAQPSTSKGKTTLSQELQLYFTRLTAALLPSLEARSTALGGAAGLKEGELGEAERARLAALASLRGDTGLQGLVAYLVRWLGEKVAQNLTQLQELQYLLESVNALVSNQTLFLEPFLHQILPIILSPLLTYPLGPSPPAQARKSDPSPTEVRLLASQVLQALVREFGAVYETLVPRLTKTLLRSLGGGHPAGRVEGGLLGLGALGRHAVWRGLWGGTTDDGQKSKKKARVEADVDEAASGEEGEVRGPAKVKAWLEGWTAAPLWSDEDRMSVIAAAFSILPKLLTTTRPPGQPQSPLTDPDRLLALGQQFGPTLSHLLARDRWLAEGLLDLSPDVEVGEDEVVSTKQPAEGPPAQEVEHVSEESNAPVEEAHQADVSMAEGPVDANSAADQSTQGQEAPAASFAVGVEGEPAAVAEQTLGDEVAPVENGDEDDEDEDMEAVE